jgi:hypothetical protein
MREINSHKVNGLNEKIKIEAIDEKGEGGANHHYLVQWGEIDNIEGWTIQKEYLEIIFQKGPIKENGVKGVSNEAILAIVIDRLEGFQSGNFACEENKEALEYLSRAMRVLQRRTLERMNRGVEGTSQI